MEEYDHDDRDQFAKDILKMLERGSPNDVKIKLSDGEIFANKDILMARSDYFATMFSSNKFIEEETSTVDMSHCSKAVMEKIVKFLFIGEVEFNDLSLDQLLELTHMSKMMLLDSNFQVQAEEYAIDDKIFKCNHDVKFLTGLIPALKSANQYNLEGIKYYIIETLWISLSDCDTDVGSTDAFKSLPFDLLRDILLFDHPDYSDHVKYEDDRTTTKERFDAFMSWLSENEVTEEQKEEIVESFNFEEFTVEELMTSVRKSDLYPTNKIDKRLLGLFKEQNELVQSQSNLLKEKDKLLKEKDKLLKAKDNLLRNSQRNQ